MDMMAGVNLTAGQQQALNELREVEEADPAALEILEIQQPTPIGWLPIMISIETADVIPDSKTASTGPRACRTYNGVMFCAYMSRQQQSGSLQMACSDFLTGYSSGWSGRLRALSIPQGSHSIRRSHTSR